MLHVCGSAWCRLSIYYWREINTQKPMSVIMLFFKCRQTIFFVKFDAYFDLKYATKISKEKVLPLNK